MKGINRAVFKPGEKVCVMRSENFYRSKILLVDHHNTKTEIVSLMGQDSRPIRERYRYVRAADLERQP
jgi:hypothetical protein